MFSNKVKMEIKSELKYTKDHEWISIDGDQATIGITDYAQGELGDIVYVEIESIGDELNQEEILVLSKLLKQYLIYLYQFQVKLLK